MVVLADRWKIKNGGTSVLKYDWLFNANAVFYIIMYSFCQEAF